MGELAGNRFRWRLHDRWHLAAVAGGILILSIGGGFYWLRVRYGDLHIATLTPDDVVRFARTWEPWSAIAAIALMIVHSFLPFPSEVVAIASGMMFGLALGVVVTWSGAMLGAVLSFAIARVIGRPAMRYIVPKRYSNAMQAWEPRVTTLLLMRLIPVISFNLINYGAGLARVAWWPFLWTTGLGILPLTVISVAFGSHILELGWRTALGIAVGVRRAMDVRPSTCRPALFRRPDRGRQCRDRTRLGDQSDEKS